MADLLSKYDLKKVVNASGRMSILGVSTPSDMVMNAMREGGQQYVEMSELVNNAGNHIAKILGSEAAIVVNSASSGIALSVASFITRGNVYQSQKLHAHHIPKNDIILLKGHNVQYGAPIETMVHLGGGNLVEVGFANEGKQSHIESAISDETAAILYVQSHHAVQKNMISVQEAWEVANRNNVPLIVDAAAEEDLQKYIPISDLVIYSGSKALEGPTSGIVAGKKQYVEWLKTQTHFIGRSMKVGKEVIFGLLKALEEYTLETQTANEQKEKLAILNQLNEHAGIRVETNQDPAGRNIFRAKIQLDHSKSNLSAEELSHALKNGRIAIYTRDHGANLGFIEVDPRPLTKNDVTIIYERINEILEGEKK